MESPLRFAGSLLAPDNHLFVADCVGCPAWQLCPKTYERQCQLSTKDSERAQFFEHLSERIAKLGGVEARACPGLQRQPELPRVLHIHASSTNYGIVDRVESVGLYGSDVIRLDLKGCPVSLDRLVALGADTRPKVLVLSERDAWFQKFLNRVGEEFFSSVSGPTFTAVIAPNLSFYGHSEHRVWILNRALIQNFTEVMLSRGIPGVFFTYLDESKQDFDWLVSYLRLNPDQHFLATGFDRGSANDANFLTSRLLLIAKIQSEIGRPLNIVLGNIIAREHAIGLAADLFPSRVHLAAASIVQRSIDGSELVRSASGWVTWQKRSYAYGRGAALFAHNRRVLEAAIARRFPKFLGQARKLSRSSPDSDSGLLPFAPPSQ